LKHHFVKAIEPRLPFAALNALLCGYYKEKMWNVSYNIFELCVRGYVEIADGSVWVTFFAEVLHHTRVVFHLAFELFLFIWGRRRIRIGKLVAEGEPK